MKVKIPGAIAGELEFDSPQRHVCDHPGSKNFLEALENMDIQKRGFGYTYTLELDEDGYKYLLDEVRYVAEWDTSWVDEEGRRAIHLCRRYLRQLGES